MERSRELLKGGTFSRNRTQYDVTDTSGTVQIAAHKNDVKIERIGALGKTSSQSSLFRVRHSA